MRVLLTGGSGLLGNAFKNAFESHETTFLAPNHRELDLLDFPAVDKFLIHEAPDMIVHCAAYTGVDTAEKERGTCERMNVHVLKNILQHRIPIVHFSTDYVFDTPVGTEIPENFPRHPRCWYGQTKLDAEKLLETSGTRWWNIRTSWMFGPGGQNFVDTIVDRARRGVPLTVVDDEWGRPTYAPDLAELVVREFLKSEKPSGHFHVQNTGEPVSWAGLAETAIASAELSHPVGHIPADEVIPPRAADRPKNSVLHNSKLPPLRDWDDAVREHVLNEKN